MTAIRTGYYKLTADVKNPKPDGRSKRRLDSVDVWKAGTIVHILDQTEKTTELIKSMTDKTPVDAPVQGNICFKDNTTIPYNLGTKDKDFTVGNGILSVIEPAERSLGQILKNADWSPSGLLALLIDAGKITLEDVEALMHHELCPGSDDEVEDEKLRDAADQAFHKRHEINGY